MVVYNSPEKGSRQSAGRFVSRDDAEVDDAFLSSRADAWITAYNAGEEALAAQEAEIRGEPLKG